MPRVKQCAVKNASGSKRARASDSETETDTSEGSPVQWDHVDGQAYSAAQIGGFARPTLANFSSLPRRTREGAWGSRESMLYNAWLRVQLRSSRFLCPFTLRRMGIRDSVQNFLRRIGLGTFASQTYPLYPELVRQFFASVEMGSRVAGTSSDARDYFLYFIIRGRSYELSIARICQIYGFDAQRRGIHIPTGFHEPLWRAIADPADVFTRKIARIRHPVLRVVAKILASLFYGKEEPATLTLPETSLLHYGLPDSVYYLYGDTLASIPPELDANLGYIFAETLMGRKTRVLRGGRSKTEFMGSLLTPLFEACRIELHGEVSDTSIVLMDAMHFRSSHILYRDDVTYEFTDAQGIVQFCTLPLPDLADPVSAAALAFVPPPEAGRGRLGRQRLRGRPQPPQSRDSLGLDTSSDSDQYDFQQVPIAEDTSEMWRVYFANREKEQRLTLRLRRKVNAIVRWITCGAPPATRSEIPETSRAAEQRAHGDSGDGDDADDVVTSPGSPQF